MAVDDLTDWKGNAIRKERHGGVRAANFIHFMVLVTSIAYVANVLNLVTYLQGTMHMDISSSSTMVTNFIGVSCAFALLGAFLSDSYITRFKTVLIFAPFEVLGYGLLTLQAHLPSLRPPKCNTSGQCEQVQGSKASLLTAAIYIIALGEGCLRACLASFGGDQFDIDDPNESQQRSSFFNWFAFGISTGALIGVVLIVWIENNKGWDYGFGVSGFVVLLGLIVVVTGFPFYRNQKPKGSPLTRMLQVFVAAFRKRKVKMNESPKKLQLEEGKEGIGSTEVLPHTKGLGFLDKAAIEHGDMDAWSFCTVTQVEETKIFIRMLPIFISSVLSYTPIPLLLTFTVQQGATLNTKLGSIHISPASLFVIPVIFQVVILIVYDRLFVPFARKITGYTSGITQLQRVAAGYISIILASCIAALVENKRRRVIEENGLQNSLTGLPMSVFWLAVQFFFLGVSDVTSFVGLLEFFATETSTGMKSLGTAIFWCVLGLASLMGTFCIEAVNAATGHSRTRKGWLEGDNLNRSRLDLFYWLLSFLGVLSFLNYLYWAKRYVYRHNPRVSHS